MIDLRISINKVMNVKLTIFFFFILLIFRTEVVHGNDFPEHDSCMCNISNLVKMQECMDSVTETDIVDFLWTFDGRCKNNAEYCEFSNEILHSLLCNEKVYLLMKVLSEHNDLPIENLMQAIENPIDDLIDLNKAQNNIKTIKEYKTIRDSILKSIDIAMSKYKS